MVLLNFFETSDFIIFNKPFGLNTHGVDSEKPGLVEFLSEQLDLKLYVVSRLDQSTSGLILLAKAQGLEKVTQAWNEKETHKAYIFITDREFPNPTNSEILAPISPLKDHSQEKPHFMLKSEIKKTGKNYISITSPQPNSETEFQFLRSIGKYFLWRAHLHTGKTHQIRLHCQQLKIPILGDSLYQGTPFYRLGLHSKLITIFNQTFESQDPIWADSKAECFLKLSPELQLILDSIQKRQQCYSILKQDCFRWLHQELHGLKLDQFGDYLYLYDYTEEKKFSGFIAEIISEKMNKPIFVRSMIDRGENPNKNELYFYSAQEKSRTKITTSQTWLAQENDISYQFRTNQGLSPGLFLDQRENRKWIKANSKNKSVLNLFSYTGGFSLAAALGEASEVDTVDISKNFIDWSKYNFSLNNLSLENLLDNKNKYRFWIQDSLFFLKMSVKKNKKWDLIICDPPTFGRGNSGIFRIEKHLSLLIADLTEVLNPRGKILISTNYEKWDAARFRNKIQSALKPNKYQILNTPLQSLDFDYPHQPQLMKSYLIESI